MIIESSMRAFIHLDSKLFNIAAVRDINLSSNVSLYKKDETISIIIITFVYSFYLVYTLIDSKEMM